MNKRIRRKHAKRDEACEWVAWRLERIIAVLGIERVLLEWNRPRQHTRATPAPKEPT